MVAGRLVGARIGHAVVGHDRLLWLGQLDVATQRAGGHVDDDRARLHLLDRSLRHQHRRPAARHLGGRDDDVHAADVAVELVLLGFALLGRSIRAHSRLIRSRRQPT
jgi:hypothetical protein